MLTKLKGAAVFGINAVIIQIEVNIINGLRFHVTGLPDSAIKESQYRIESALKSNDYGFPRQKVIVNLAPADLKKEGSSFDLPIALGILASKKILNAENTGNYIVMGELSLDGTVKPIKGVLPITLEAVRHNIKGVLLPAENAEEAAIVNNIQVFGVNHLSEAINFFNNKATLKVISRDPEKILQSKLDQFPVADFSEVKGQENIKRALEIAAAGGHNVALIGPPGSGKTMLAKRLPGILPPITLNEALETTKIHSVAGKVKGKTALITRKPFRSPHHTISYAAMVGGGSIPQPGEISLAHNGVLFLDELPEFRRNVLEVLRQPLEERKITISRSRFSVEYPANFMLVASMNPCPCGFYNHPEKECVCQPGLVQRYLNRISGPLMDRIDLHVEVVPVTFDELTSKRTAESSLQIRNRVNLARKIQQERFSNLNKSHAISTLAETGMSNDTNTSAIAENTYNIISANANMNTKLTGKFCILNKAGESLLKTAIEKLSLSARAYERILKVSRTIADLDGKDTIQTEHIAEAIHYRSLDREDWGN